jgi:hypothetical protein
MKQSQQNKQSKLLQASKTTTKGVKRPPSDLSEIISIVNLVPRDADLPETLFPTSLLDQKPPFRPKQMLLALLAEMPDTLDKLRLYLLEYAMRPDLVVHPPTHPSATKMTLALVRYREIREWRDNLRRIARREQSIRTSAEGLINWQTGTVSYGRDTFGVAIDKVDLRYIRECGECGRLYFAPKLTYKGEQIEPRCSPACGKKIRDRRYGPRRQDYQARRTSKEAAKDRKQIPRRVNTARER